MADKQFLDYAENKLITELIYFSKNKITLKQATLLAKDIIEKMDWENEMLMHKGFSWIAKNSIL